MSADENWEYVFLFFQDRRLYMMKSVSSGDNFYKR